MSSGTTVTHTIQIMYCVWGETVYALLFLDAYNLQFLQSHSSQQLKALMVVVII